MKPDKSRKAAPPAAKAFSVEAAVGLAITAVVVFFHLVLLQHAGGLWRDEVNSVNLSTPGQAGLLDFNGNDSFPILWFLILRGYIASGLGASDLGLRILGCAVGLAILALLWLTGRKMGGFVPLVALVLFALNPQNLRWDDTVRAYGLGVCLLLMTLWLVWQVTRAPTRWNVALAVIFGILSVQSVFYNSFLLLTIALGGVAVCLRKRLWKRALLLLAIGLPAALSLLPYAGVITSMHQWNVLVKVDLTLPMIWDKLRYVLVSPGEFMVRVWLVLGGLAVVLAGLVQLRALSRWFSDEQRDLALFTVTTLLLGVAGYLLFLKRLSYPTEPWYYISLTALVAICVDVILSAVTRSGLLKYARVVLALVVVACSFETVWSAMQNRNTNVDLVAGRLNEEVAAGDLVVVAPWWDGLTFDRYYHGSAPWMTVPPIEFHKYHRYDLTKQMMLNPRATEPVLLAMEQTLAAGHRVWVVGGLTIPKGRPTVLPPPPLPRTDWHEWPYDVAWSEQAGYVLGLCAQRIEPLAVEERVNFYEKVWLCRASGYRPGGP